jgi:hypothetical protein
LGEKIPMGCESSCRAGVAADNFRYQDADGGEFDDSGALGDVLVLLGRFVNPNLRIR